MNVNSPETRIHPPCRRLGGADYIILKVVGSGQAPAGKSIRENWIASNKLHRCRRVDGRYRAALASACELRVRVWTLYCVEERPLGDKAHTGVTRRRQPQRQRRHRTSSWRPLAADSKAEPSASMTIMTIMTIRMHACGRSAIKACTGILRCSPSAASSAGLCARSRHLHRLGHLVAQALGQQHLQTRRQRHHTHIHVSQDVRKWRKESV